jgi:hypothetical protein
VCLAVFPNVSGTTISAWSAPPSSVSLALASRALTNFVIDAKIEGSDLPFDSLDALLACPATSDDVPAIFAYIKAHAFLTHFFTNRLFGDLRRALRRLEEETFLHGARYSHAFMAPASTAGRAPITPRTISVETEEQPVL